MKLQHILTELFNQPYEYEQSWANASSFGCAFTTEDGSKVNIQADNVGLEMEPQVSLWDISFFRDGTDRVNGEGDAPRIFATVIAIIQAYGTKYNMQYIMLGSSKGQSNRGKLYGRMVARYAPQAGYTNLQNYQTNPDVPNEMKLSLRKEFPGLEIQLLRKN